MFSNVPANAIVGCDFVLEYNPSVLSITGITPGNIVKNLREALIQQSTMIKAKWYSYSAKIAERVLNPYIMMDYLQQCK